MGKIKVTGLDTPIGKVADHHNSRYALGSVLVEVTHPGEAGSKAVAIATDGRMLVAVPCVANHGPDMPDESWSRPLVAGCQAFIAAKQLEKKALKKEARHFLAAEPGMPSALVSSKTGTTLVETPEVRFPNWRGVLTTSLVEDEKPTIDNTTIRIGLNAGMLATLAEALGAENGGEIFLTFKSSGLSPIVVDAPGTDGIGVMMPISGDAKESRESKLSRVWAKIAAIVRS